ncbi:hypothetical protein [Spirulina sp. 06S082]|nr:hypothetical protein [Spirulina sp. 06S082]MEA5471385.1 hypothetical protein [Spirulina sp. 06S082]
MLEFRQLDSDLAMRLLVNAIASISDRRHLKCNISSRLCVLTPLHLLE